MRVHASIEKASDWCVSHLYLVGAESKILKQSKLQEVRQDSETCKCF